MDAEVSSNAPILGPDTATVTPVAPADAPSITAANPVVAAETSFLPSISQTSGPGSNQTSFAFPQLAPAKPTAESFSNTDGKANAASDQKGNSKVAPSIFGNVATSEAAADSAGAGPSSSVVASTSPIESVLPIISPGLSQPMTQPQQDAQTNHKQPQNEQVQQGGGAVLQGTTVSLSSTSRSPAILAPSPSHVEQKQPPASNNSLKDVILYVSR
jgi:hypothetical protein